MSGAELPDRERRTAHFQRYGQNPRAQHGRRIGTVLPIEAILLLKGSPRLAPFQVGLEIVRAMFHGCQNAPLVERCPCDLEQVCQFNSHSFLSSKMKLNRLKLNPKL